MRRGFGNLEIWSMMTWNAAKNADGDIADETVPRNRVGAGADGVWGRSAVMVDFGN